MVGSIRKAPSGFTLAELLVSIIVIGLLLALLMPFVTRSGVREAGRRSACNNSMRQLALATLQFESAKMRFPGYLEQPILEHEREVPWLVSLMPYLERNDINDSWMNPAGKAAKLYLKVLRCPSDPLANAKDDCNSYVGNAGLIVKTMTNTNSAYEDDNVPANGIFVDLRRYREDPSFVRSKDIFDGQSNTLLISENLLAGRWGDVNPVIAPGKPESKIKLTTAFCWFDTETPSADMRINGNRQTAKKLTPELLRPSSNHPGAVNVAFADGHTQYLRDNVDYRVYKQLMTPNSKNSSNSEKDYVLKDEDYE